MFGGQLLAARIEPDDWPIAQTAVLNTTSPSAGERRTWVPVAAVMLVCSLVVALTTT